LHSTINLTLALDCDTAAHPDALSGRQASLGRLVTGFPGLLGVLETQLGLSGPTVSTAARIAAYHDRLSAWEQEAFFSRSLKADGWATAKVLLGWRDELLLAGWNPAESLDAPPRLQTLAAIEDQAAAPLPPGLPERLSAVIRALHEAIQLPLEITCLDAPEELPAHWRRLLERLHTCGVSVSWQQAPAAEARGLLGSLQQAMRQNTPVASPGADDSLCLIKGRSRREAAEALALWLQGLDDSQCSKIVFISNGGCQELDAALERRSLPRLGVNAPSPWRGALQVLPALFATRWRPRDPQAMFEFLSLPVSPLHGKVARLFRKALCEHFGFDGPEWQKAWQEAIQYLEDKDSFSGSPENFLTKWLDGPLFAEKEGCPAQIAASLCEDVANWAGSRGAIEESELLTSASEIARNASASFRELGETLLSKVQTERILETAMTHGTSAPGAFREAAPWHVVEHHSQIRGQAEVVVWWDFVGTETLPRVDSWTREERRWLAAKDCPLEEPEKEFRRRARAWRRPLLHARRQVVFVQPESDLQEPTPPHPLLAEVLHFLKLGAAGLGELTVDASQLHKFPESVILGVAPAMQPASQPPLPMPKSVWSCDSSHPFMSRSLSFSSLEKLLRCPLAWVLERHAGLSPGALFESPGLEAAKGNLAHHAMTSVLMQPEPMTPQDAAKFVEERLDEWIEQMAAQLLLPGFEQEAQELRSRLPLTAQRMVELVEAAGLRFLGSEDDRERAVDDDLFVSGRLDLVFETPEGQPVCWDMKWTKWGSYKRKELEDGLATQLAVYAWLIEEEKSPPAVGGYFMLKDGELYSVDFKGLSCRAVESPCSLQEQWESLLQSLRNRLSVLGKGRVTASAMLPKEEQSLDQPFFLEPNCKFCNYTTLCPGGTT